MPLAICGPEKKVRCTACGATWSRDAYGEAVARAAMFDAQAAGLDEDGYCPKCGEYEVIEEVAT